ncbi:MAG: polysaccharide biosynthesis/export family protein [Pseudomonadota bacterium]
MPNTLCRSAIAILVLASVACQARTPSERVSLDAPEPVALEPILAPTSTNLPAETPATDRPYTLSSGDMLEILVHGAPELGRTIPVGPDGFVRIPFSGPVMARGETIETLQARLNQALSRELIAPDIEVLLLSTAPAATE